MTVVVRIWCGERGREGQANVCQGSLFSSTTQTNADASETGRSARADLSEIAQQDSTDLSLGYWFEKVVAETGRL